MMAGILEDTDGKHRQDEAEALIETQKSLEGPDHHNDRSLNAPTDALDNNNNNNNNNKISLDDAVEMVGMGRFQHVMFLTVGLCFSADAIQVMILAYLSLVLKKEWDLSNAESSFVTASVFFGAMVGSVLFGPLADFCGRRVAFLVAALDIALFGVLTSWANNYATLIGLLLCVGVGVGGVTVPYDTMAEFLPNQQRGRSLLALQYFWTMGALMALGAAYISLQILHSWKFLVVIGSVPCWISAFVGWFVVPETPRWLCSQGRDDEALQVLRLAAIQNGHDADVLFPLGTELVEGVVSDDNDDDDDDEDKPSDCAVLLQPEWLYIILTLCVIWSGFGLLYYGAILSITQIFATDDSNNNNNDDGINFDYAAIFTSSSAELVGVTIVLYTVDGYGRIASQAWSYLLGGVCIGTLSYGATAGWHHAVLEALAFGTRLFMMSATCVTWIITPELLATQVRATGHGLVNALARVAGSMAPFVVQAGASTRLSGIILTIISVIVALSVLLLPETAGKTLGGAHQSDDDGEDDKDERDGNMEREPFTEGEVRNDDNDDVWGDDEQVEEVAV